MNDYSGRFTLVNGKLHPLVSGEWVAYEYAYKCYMEALSIVGERNDRIAQAQIRIAELEARCAKYKVALSECVEALEHCEIALHMRVNPPTLLNAKDALTEGGEHG